MLKYSLLVAALLTGCATNLPEDKRSPEQIAAAVKDKSMTGICTRVNSPWGVGIAVQFSVDAKVVTNGNVQVTEQCNMSFQNLTPSKAASAP